MKPTNQSTNQSTNQPTNQSTNQPTNKTTLKTILLVFLFSFLFLPSAVFALDFDGALKEVTITDTGGTNTPPSAVISRTIVSQDPLIVDFDASGSTDSDGSVAEYRWDFGDGATGIGATVSHTFSTSGIFPVTLNVVDEAGAIALKQIFITVAPSVEVQINLWEDEHQTPVLESFTNPGLINYHDGNWDEFDYTGRPFPSIMAGHNETENNGLQLMHFHAENIANGQYEVWANLYTGRHTRHYYGYSEAEALAESSFVDNVQDEGGSDQHEEYLLGTIEITNGSFNLWAGDADILSGRDYLYGWAWIKLIPDE